MYIYNASHQLRNVLPRVIFLTKRLACVSQDETALCRGVSMDRRQKHGRVKRMGGRLIAGTVRQPGISFEVPTIQGSIRGEVTSGGFAGRRSLAYDRPTP